MIAKDGMNFRTEMTSFYTKTPLLRRCVYKVLRMFGVYFKIKQMCLTVSLVLLSPSVLFESYLKIKQMFLTVSLVL